MAFATLSLKGRALRLLSQREHSRAELATKLARHVQEGDDLEAVLDDLEANDFINAERVAESVVHRRAGRLGTQRLVQELRSKGLSDGLVRNTADRLRATELERAQAVWQQRFGGAPATDPKERARQMRFLAARGFAGDVVRRVLREAERGVYDDILIDQGDADSFLADQLKPELLKAAAETAGQKITIRMQPGYDHSYFFMTSFIDDHMAFHAARLKGPNDRSL